MLKLIANPISRGTVDHALHIVLRQAITSPETAPESLQLAILNVVMLPEGNSFNCQPQSNKHNQYWIIT